MSMTQEESLLYQTEKNHPNIDEIMSSSSISSMLNNDNDLNLSSPPTWEALDLVSHHLDPQSLVLASCVCKTWCTCFSSDHLWDPLCTTHFPLLTSSLRSVAASVPRCRVYALGHAAALRRWPKQPRKPQLSLDRLLFVLSIRHPGRTVDVIKRCADMQWDPHGVFRFDVEFTEDKGWTLEELKDVKVTWTVVEREWKAVFTVAEEIGGNLSSAVDGFFSKELPAPGCCSSTMSSGLVADFRFGLKDQAKSQDYNETHYGCDKSSSSRVSRIDKVSVGVMNVFKWRYVSVDDGLLYLEHFLQV